MSKQVFNNVPLDNNSKNNLFQKLDAVLKYLNDNKDQDKEIFLVKHYVNERLKTNYTTGDIQSILNKLIKDGYVSSGNITINGNVVDKTFYYINIDGEMLYLKNGYAQKNIDEVNENTKEFRKLILYYLYYGLSTLGIIIALVASIHQ